MLIRLFLGLYHELCIADGDGACLVLAARGLIITLNLSYRAVRWRSLDSIPGMHTWNLYRNVRVPRFFIVFVQRADGAYDNEEKQSARVRTHTITTRIHTCNGNTAPRACFMSHQSQLPFEMKWRTIFVNPRPCPFPLPLPLHVSGNESVSQKC